MDTPEGAPRPVLAAPDCAVVLHGFAAVPARLVADRSISHTELRLLLALAAHAGPEQECWPGVERLAAIVGLTGRQVRRVLRSLEGSGYVKVFKRERSDGTQTSNLYKLRFSRWDESGSADAHDTPGGSPITDADPDKNVRAGDAECQGPPDTIMSAPLIDVEPLHSNQKKPPNPPRAGDIPYSANRYNGPGKPKGRTTRKEKEQLQKWERAVGQTCEICRDEITIEEIAYRDVWGVLRSGLTKLAVPVGPEPRDIPDGCESIGDLVRYAVQGTEDELSPYDFMHWIAPIRAELERSNPVLWFPDIAHRDWVVENHGEVLTRTFPEGYETNFAQSHQAYDRRIVHTGCADMSIEKPHRGSGE